jgi:hypothetical protein
VVLCREEGCDVAVEDEVGLDRPLDRLDDLGIGAMDQIPDLVADPLLPVC